MTAAMHRERTRETPWKCPHLWCIMFHEDVAGYRAARFVFDLELRAGKEQQTDGSVSDHKC
jgi:hypothetical protein